MNTLAGRIIGIVLLALVAWVCSIYVPAPFGTIIAVLCGVGAVILVVFLILDLVRGAP